MKKLKTILIYTLLGLSIFQTIQAQHNTSLTQDLIAHYKFNGNLKDASGNNNQGKMKGGVYWIADRFGNQCAALDFNGMNGYIQVPSSPSLNKPRNSFSVTSWFKLREGSRFSDLRWITICCKSNLSEETENSPHYRVQSTKVTVSLNTDFTEETPHEVEFDVWHFYALVYDGKEVKVFLDGYEMFNFPYSKKLLPNNLPLEIGRDKPGNEELMYGGLDDIRIYSRALKEDEVQQIFNDTSESAGTFNYCPKNMVIETKEDNDSKIDYQHEVTVKKPNITIYFYDHEKGDGDIVSVKVGKDWVLEKYKLRKKKQNLKQNKNVSVYLEPYKSYTLISRAWNLGKIPPNTLTIEIDDGTGKTQAFTVNSKIGKSGAVKIMYKP